MALMQRHELDRFRQADNRGEREHDRCDPPDIKQHLPAVPRHQRGAGEAGERAADVAFTQYHLVSYWTRLFPNHFELVPVSGAERFFVKIALARVIDPLRLRALKAFEEFSSTAPEHTDFAAVVRRSRCLER